MTIQIVQCEVYWVVYVGHSGNEQPPARFSTLGEFHTKEEATRALKDEGFTQQPLAFWRDNTGYGVGYISRILREINNVAE